MYPARYSAMFGKVLIPVSVSEKQNGVSFHKYGNKSFVLFSCEIHKPSISEGFSDSRNGESLPNGPGNNWPKRKIQPVTIPKPKSVFFFFERKPKSVADARTARKLKVAVMDPNGVRSVVYCADMVHRSLATLKLFISPSTTGHAYLLSAQVLIKKIRWTKTVDHHRRYPIQFHRFEVSTLHFQSVLKHPKNQAELLPLEPKPGPHRQRKRRIDLHRSRWFLEISGPKAAIFIFPFPVGQLLRLEASRFLAYLFVCCCAER